MPHVHEVSLERTAQIDPLAWDVPVLATFARSLVNLTGAATIPSVEEWAVLADKVL